MSENNEGLNELAGQLSGLPFGDYLESEAFARFSRRYDLHDAWREFLRLSQDRPDLIGEAVLDNAFLLFLDHIRHRQPAAFLSLLTGLLADFSRGVSCRLPVDGIRDVLIRQGYAEPDVTRALFVLRIRQEPARSRRRSASRQKGK